MTEDTSGIDSAFRPQRRPEVHAIELDGELVLYDPTANRLHILDRTASLLWQCFDGVGTIAEIAFDVSSELSERRSTVEHGALSLARELARAGLLVRPDP